MKDTPIVNYMFSLGFIFLLVIMIFSFSAISKFVFQENTAIQEHVKNTQTLLDNIDEVKRSTSENKSIEETNNNIYSDTFIDLDLQGYQLNDISYLNIENNKAIMTFIINSKISDYNNTYYLEIKDSSKLKPGYYVLFTNEGNINKGKIITIIDNELTIFDEKNKQLSKAYYNDILGRIIMEN